MKVFSQLEKAQLENVTSDTANLPKGMITYRTDLNIAKVSNGTSMLALIDESSTQTLSNKTYASPITTGAFTMAQTTTPSTPASGNNKLYFKADGFLYTLDPAGNEAKVGSGSGGVVNLITNGSADDSASSIFVPYADTGTRPVDGTGGSPTVTTSVTTTSPLNGTKSYLLTKPASNVQGQGWAVPFTLDTVYKAKSLKISADYIINSGTFVPGSNGVSPTDGDLIWYIYDVTNSQLIEPSNIKMFSNSTSLADKFEATFQTSATGSSYRLIAHVASTSALAFEIKLDNITVSPQVYVYGTPVTNWSAQETTTGSLTNATYRRKWRQEGDSIRERIQVEFSSAPGGTNPLVIATKFTVDTTKLNGGAISNTESLGVAHFTDASTGIRYTGSVCMDTANGIRLQGDSGTTGNWGSLNPVTIGASDFIEIDVLYPAVGLSGSVRTSDQADTRVVAAKAFQNVGQSIPNNTLTIIDFSTKTFDTHGSITTGAAWKYTAQIEGYYEVDVVTLLNASTGWGANEALELDLYKNGAFDSLLYYNNNLSTANNINVTSSGSTVVYLKAGDYIDVRMTQQSGAAITLATPGYNHISIRRVSGPSAIAASDQINAIYKTSAGQVLGVGVVILDFGTKEEDSHGLVTVGASWKFTAQQNRLYRVSGAVRFDTASRRLDLYKNGSFVRALFEPSAASETEGFNTTIRLNAGDYIDLRANNGSAASLFGDDRFNYVCIEGV